MENNKREKSNSLTHLTKILVKEVMESDLKNIYNRLCHLETHNEIEKETKKIVIDIDVKEFLNNIKNKLDNVGESWEKEEEEILKREMKVAIATIAANHGRTVGAITSRLENMKFHDRYSLEA